MMLLPSKENSLIKNDLVGERLKVLVMLPRIPYPLRDGGAIVMYNLVKGLKENDVDLFKIASSLALMAQGTEPLLLSEKEVIQPKLNSKDNKTRRQNKASK